MSRPIESSIEASGHPEPAPGEELRAALRDWPAGVVIVTAQEDGRPQALTVTSFAPVTLRPPLVLVCLHVDAPLTDVLLASGRFAVSLLAHDQKGIANRFSDRFPVGTDALEDIDGVPTVPGAVWRLVCDLHANVDGGDHRILIGAVRRVVRSQGDPLLYLRREYGAAFRAT